MSITRASAKSKGRKMVFDIKDILLQTFSELNEDDIVIPSGSAPGEDIVFSPKARQLLGMSIEAKNQQSISIWSAMTQCEKNAKTYMPVFIFKRNRSQVYACLSLENLLKIIKKTI